MNVYQQTQSLLEYLYSLDDKDFRDLDVLDAVRALLESENEEVREIAFLRLGCRAKDPWIIEKCLEVLRNGEEAELVFSSAVAALVCLADSGLNRETIIEEIENAFKHSIIENRNVVLQRALGDLGKTP